MHAYTGKMLIQFRFHLLYQSFLTVACQVMNNLTVIVDDEKMNFFLIRLFCTRANFTNQIKVVLSRCQINALIQINLKKSILKRLDSRGRKTVEL